VLEVYPHKRQRKKSDRASATVQCQLVIKQFAGDKFLIEGVLINKGQAIFRGSPPQLWHNSREDADQKLPHTMFFSAS
jgi:hypothetical protein